MSGLSVRDVMVQAGDRTIIGGVSFEAGAGEVTGLIGPNGAGKSTMIAAALGLRPLTRGSIRLDELDLPGLSVSERAKVSALVEQFAATSERLTVTDVVALGRLPFQSAWQSRPSAHDMAVVSAAIAELGIGALALRLYHTLSGGEQQRVQLARALAQEPRLLLLDEPTSHLDIRAQLLVLDLLRRRAKAGSTVLIALHDLNLAARYCDRLVMLGGGRVAATGTPAEVLTPGLLLDVYGVHAEVIALPGRLDPVVIYERAIADDEPRNPIDKSAPPAKL